MPAERYYIRSRGRITGPFGLADLQRLIRRGVISRTDGVSSDRTTWAPAGDFQELFPAPAIASAPAAASPPAAAAQEAPPLVSNPAPATVATKFYYSQAGATIGPVPLMVLKALAMNGTLQAADMVWQENSQVAVPACQISDLAPIFSAARESVLSPRTSIRVDPSIVRSAAQKVARLITAIGLGVGIVLLVFLNLPMASVAGKVVWCWSAVGERGAGAFVTWCVLLLTCGLTLCIVTPTTKGTVRGVTLMVIFGVVGLFLLASMLQTDAPGAGFLMVLALFVLPALCAAVVANGHFRSVFPNTGAGATLQVVFSILLAVSALTLGITMLVHSEGAATPGGLLAAFVLIVLSHALALACGILGLISSLQNFSRTMNRAIEICAAVSYGMVVLALLTVSLAVADSYGIWRDATRGFNPGILDELPSPGAIAFVVFRVAATFLSIALLAGTGLVEILFGMHASAAQTRTAPASHTNTELANALTRMSN